jgi:hypothetical protein
MDIVNIREIEVIDLRREVSSFLIFAEATVTLLNRSDIAFDFTVHNTNFIRTQR